MAKDKLTIFDRLNNALMGSSIPKEMVTDKYSNISNDILFTTNDKAEYERKLSQYRQQKLLSHQWVKAGQDATMQNLAGYTATRLMYRDADLMDACPEIGSALDIISDEVCTISSDGKMLRVNSKSSRIKSILEDLYNNRLMIRTWLPMIARGAAKYGNDFMLLNVTKDDGILGWRELPVYDMERIESGYPSMHPYETSSVNYNDLKPDEIKFVWAGHNESDPYQNWQIAHFRLLNDSFFLPYGTSLLHKARRAWRMWSMMEDAMLIYRLDRSVERRVFKIYVGGIDEQDVQAYVQDIANNFKRTPIIDPQTGQVDLRKAFPAVDEDYFIPTRDLNSSSPIETLQSAQTQTSMDDINYMQNKILTAMRVPKTFLNFQEAQGKGQNLSFIDVRFSRMINRIQEYLLLELQKIGQIHLYLLGMKDEMTNFSLSLNNPSSQIKQAELDDTIKRLGALQTALADPGNGFPMMSLHKGLKEIMGMSEKEIKDMLLEIRLEKGMAAEVASTQAVIKKSGVFYPVDRIYGDFNALNSDNPPQPQDGGDNGIGGGPKGGGGAPLPGGMDMDLGEPGAEGNGDLGGEEGSMGMESAPAADNGGPVESANPNKPLILEKVKSFTAKYLDLLAESEKNNDDDYVDDSVMDDFEGKTRTLEEKTSQLMNKIDRLIGTEPNREPLTENIEEKESVEDDELQDIL